MCWIFGDYIFQERSDFLKVFIDCQVFVSVTITFIFDITVVPKITNFVIIFFLKRVLTSLVILSFIASFCFVFFQFEKIFYTLNCVIIYACFFQIEDIFCTWKLYIYFSFSSSNLFTISFCFQLFSQYKRVFLALKVLLKNFT